MPDEVKLHKLEGTKENSQQLRGTIADELLDGTDTFTEDAKQLLKHHGTYLQDNRDTRGAKNADGTKVGKSYSCMVRTRIPGGKVTAEQFLAELDLCDKYGNGTVRLTTRQGFQLHGVLKGNLKETIRAINDSKLTTFAACGDVERNVMCCPAPFRNNPVRDDMQAMADAVAEHLKPRTSGYFDIWLTDEDGEKINVADRIVEEPIYGPTYLPRKFKTAFALPEDNCVDVYTHDLGFVAIVEDDKIAGYNVLVGGGQGRTPSATKTFPTVARKMTFVTPDQVLAISEAIVKVQRDFGNRSDRKIARMKYLIHDWGLPKFKAKVEEYFGAALPEPNPIDVHGVEDHIGWFDQSNGNWFLGINVENGRVKDEGDFRLKTALRTILEKFGMETRLTALQGVILCDIAPDDRAEIDQILADHGVKNAEQLTSIRKLSIACPAFPTCGLSITESERVMPQVIDNLEVAMKESGIDGESIAVHMTGCPNGCARPYTPDIGLVGKAKGKYTIFLGGNTNGTRIGEIFADMIPLDDIAPTIAPVFTFYKNDRQSDESFGDFCHRIGNEQLKSRFVTDA